MSRLNQKLCVVTGAARGIGAAIATHFRAEGAHVIVTDIDHAGATALAARIGGEPFALDVANEADWQRLAEAHPQVDVLVNNAGITGFEDGPAPQDPETATLDDWRRVHAVNLDGTFLGCRYAIGAMARTTRGDESAEVFRLCAEAQGAASRLRRMLRRLHCTLTPHVALNTNGGIR